MPLAIHRHILFHWLRHLAIHHLLVHFLMIAHHLLMECWITINPIIVSTHLMSAGTLIAQNTWVEHASNHSDVPKN